MHSCNASMLYIIMTLFGFFCLALDVSGYFTRKPQNTPGTLLFTLILLSLITWLSNSLPSTYLYYYYCNIYYAYPKGATNKKLPLKKALKTSLSHLQSIQQYSLHCIKRLFPTSDIPTCDKNAVLESLKSHTTFSPTMKGPCSNMDYISQEIMLKTMCAAPADSNVWDTNLDVRIVDDVILLPSSDNCVFADYNQACIPIQSNKKRPCLLFSQQGFNYYPQID